MPYKVGFTRLNNSGAVDYQTLRQAVNNRYPTINLGEISPPDPDSDYTYIGSVKRGEIVAASELLRALGFRFEIIR